MATKGLSSQVPVVISFHEQLVKRLQDVNSILCIGLDPHLNELFPNNESIPEDNDELKCQVAYTFCKTIIEATRSVALCYKPNVAFFEALGNGGMETLRSIIMDLIKPYQIPVLLDVKRGDIGTTASAYASCCYDYLQADAVTLSPLMGYDSIEPFITGTFDMCLLSLFDSSNNTKK